MQNISVHSAQFLLIIVITNDLRTVCMQLNNNIIYVPVQLFWLAETSVYNYIYHYEYLNNILRQGSVVFWT